MTSSATIFVEPPVFRVLRTVGSAFLLTAAWLVACLPLVTAPAATVALFATVERWRRAEATSVATFLGDARRAGWSAYGLFGVHLLALIVLAADLRVAGARPESAGLTLGMTSVIALVVGMVLTQAWAGVARSVVAGAPPPRAGLGCALRAVIARPLASLGATLAWLAAGVVLLVAPRTVFLVVALALPAAAAWCSLAVCRDPTVPAPARPEP